MADARALHATGSWDEALLQLDEHRVGCGA